MLKDAKRAIAKVKPTKPSSSKKPKTPVASKKPAASGKKAPKKPKSRKGKGKGEGDAAVAEAEPTTGKKPSVKSKRRRTA